MALGALAGIIPRMRQAFHATASDADLLDRFVNDRDTEAFETLVRRHGPMVLTVCRRILRHTQDAEDAFQATFLILVYKAASVSPRSKVAGWLHGVARKTALKAKQRAIRRTQVELACRDQSPASRQLQVESQTPAQNDGPPPDAIREEVELLLDEELAEMPDRYRLPIIMCDLQGRLRSEVAGTLGCTEGTLSSRLTRGRRLLADRLKRRGVHLSVAALVVILTERTVLAESLIESVSYASLSAFFEGTFRGFPQDCLISPSVAELATGVMKTMFLKKLQAVAMAAVFATAAAFAFTGVGTMPAQVQAAPVPSTPTAPAVDEKALNESLADADTHLLMNRKVLKDMKCDIDQLDKIMDKLEAGQETAQKKRNEALMNLKQNAAGNPQAFQQMFKEAQEAGEAENRKAMTEVIATMLTVPQRKRLREIDLQARGYEAFLTPSVAKTLQLTGKQKELLTENTTKVEEGIQQGFQKPIAVGANGNVVVQGFDYNQQVREAREEGLKRALEILTDEQKAAWKKMTGEPIKYTINRPWAGRSTFVAAGGAVGGVRVLPAAAVPLPAAPPLPVAPAPNK